MKLKKRKEELVHSFGKVPEDPEKLFDTFCKELARFKFDSISRWVEKTNLTSFSRGLIEKGPREGLSTVFEVPGMPNGLIQFIVRFEITPTNLNVFYQFFWGLKIRVPGGKLIMREDNKYYTESVFKPKIIDLVTRLLEAKKKEGIEVYMSYTPEDAKIFKISEVISGLFAHKDISDVNYWQEGMGVNIVEYMSDNLEKSDVVILFCSVNSQGSEKIKKEWTSADSIGKPIIPVFTTPEDIPTLLRSRLGVQFDLADLSKSIQAIVDLVVKKEGRPDSKQKIGEPESSPSKEENPIQKKCNYFITLGNDSFESKEYKEALEYFQKALKLSEDLFDADLTLKIKNLIRQTESFIE